MPPKVEPPLEMGWTRLPPALPGEGRAPRARPLASLDSRGQALGLRQANAWRMTHGSELYKLTQVPGPGPGVHSSPE